MQNKLGTIAERLIGAVVWFVPDGSNIGTELEPVLTDHETKPADDATWEEYNLGRITQCAYDPVTQDRTRDYYSNQRRRYVRETKTTVLADAFNMTMVDYASAIFDELMFGLATAPVDDTPQPVFANNVREKRGWSRQLRVNEDKSILCLAEWRAKLTIHENPPDSFEPGSPVWRMEHLGDADDALEPITFNPAEA